MQFSICFVFVFLQMTSPPTHPPPSLPGSLDYLADSGGKIKQQQQQPTNHMWWDMEEYPISFISLSFSLSILIFITRARYRWEPSQYQDVNRFLFSKHPLRVVVVALGRQHYNPHTCALDRVSFSYFDVHFSLDHVCLFGSFAILSKNQKKELEKKKTSSNTIW